MPHRRTALRTDPSRTTVLRRQFVAEVDRRFKRLARSVRILIVVEDALGLKSDRFQPMFNSTPSFTVYSGGEDSVRVNTAAASRYAQNLTDNERWKYNTSEEKLSNFRSWTQQQIDEGILEVEAGKDAFSSQYIRKAYKKGQARAYDDATRGAKARSAAAGTDQFYRGGREQFLRSSFDRAESLDKVELLYARTFEDLKGVTQQMSTQMSRVLAEGLASGQNPNQIAQNLNDRVKKIGITRARTIARTEIIRAHAEGQLDALERLGVEEIGVMVEWSTAEDDRVCPMCEDLNGVVLTIDEARGIIPRHANCRCTYIPANVGESKKGQIRGKAAIDKRFKSSIRKEKPKLSAREAKRESSWTGADTKISKKRPSTQNAAPQPIPLPPEKPTPGPLAEETLLSIPDPLSSFDKLMKGKQ